MAEETGTATASALSGPGDGRTTADDTTALLMAEGTGTMADEIGSANDTTALLMADETGTMADETGTTAELGTADALLIAGDGDGDGAQLTTTGEALAGAVGLAPGIGTSVALLHSYCAGE